MKTDGTGYDSWKPVSYLASHYAVDAAAVVCLFPQTCISVLVSEACETHTWKIMTRQYIEGILWLLFANGAMSHGNNYQS